MLQASMQLNNSNIYHRLESEAGTAFTLCYPLLNAFRTQFKTQMKACIMTKRL